MQWKLLLVAMLIVVIAGLLLITPFGQKYTEFFRELFTKNVGAFISTVSSMILRINPSEFFTVYLSASKESFYGQSYKISNSSFSVAGMYQSMKIGDQTLVPKTSKRASIKIQNMNGLFEMTSTGNVKLSVSSDYVEIDDYIFSSTKPLKIETEVTPFSFSLAPIIGDKIVFSSVSGEIKRFKGKSGELIDTASLSNSKLEIRSFSGYIKLEEEGSMTLHGLANYVKGDTFTFS